MKLIFIKNTSALTSLLVCGGLSLVLLLVDVRTSWLSPVRSVFLSIATPFYQLTSFPGRAMEWADSSWASREGLRSENEVLRTENFVLQQKLQKMAALAAENAHLSELLNASHLVEEEVLITQLIGESADLHNNTLVLDKGSSDGVRVGQAVLDARGLAGQIIEVAPEGSRLMTIIDARSAVPVQVVRNGTRFIAEGLGVPDHLRLRHVPVTADIVIGDTLVSSGLDGHYPPDYPVARVTRVSRDPALPFLDVDVVPLAQLNRSRHFLLVLESQKRSASE